MALDKVKNYFREYKMEERIIELKESSATVKDAANALHCEERDIAKSLTFLVGSKPIMIVVAGDKRIDNSKYKEEFNEKASMIKFEDVEKLIGHGVGGVCPFGINKNVTVYLDESLKEMDYIYPACGSDNSAIKLSIQELEKYSNFTKWINVTK